MELSTIPGSPNPHPLLRPAIMLDTALETDNSIINVDIKENQNTDVLPEHLLLYSNEDEFRWPSEDLEDHTDSRIEGFKEYKEAQLKLLEFGFSHERIEAVLLKKLDSKTYTAMTCDKLVVSALVDLTSEKKIESKVNDPTDDDFPTDTSGDEEAINVLISWTIASLRTRLKRQPNPQVPGFPVNLRQNWTGLEPGRQALQTFMNSKSNHDDTNCLYLLQKSLDATITFGESGKGPGEHLHLSKRGCLRLLGQLSNSAEGLSLQSGLQSGRIKRRTNSFNFKDDNALLGVWERVAAQLRATQTSNTSANPKATLPTNTSKEEEAPTEKVATFASQAADDLKCAVCWDDLEVSSETNDVENLGELTSNCAIVRMPQCGHTLCAECAYQWLKSNITSGRLSGDAMRCPLANVPATSGGHGLSSGSNAAELEQNEVELLIRLTAKVGLGIEAEAEKAARVKAERLEKERLAKEEDAKAQTFVNEMVKGAFTALGGSFCSKRFIDRQHPLRSFNIPGEGYRCDGKECSRPLMKRGQVLFSCRACNFDLCFSCVLRQNQTKTTFLNLLGPSLSLQQSSSSVIPPPPPTPPPTGTPSANPTFPLPPPAPISEPSDTLAKPPPAPIRTIVNRPTSSTLADRPIALLFLSPLNPKDVEVVDALKKVYSRPSTSKHALENCEIVFISNVLGAGTATETARFHGSMPWPAMPFYRAEERRKIVSMFNVKGSTLIVLDTDFKILKRYQSESDIMMFDPATLEADEAAPHNMDNEDALMVAMQTLNFDRDLSPQRSVAQVELRCEYIKKAIVKDKTLSSEARELLEKRLAIARQIYLARGPIGEAVDTSNEAPVKTLFKKGDAEKEEEKESTMTHVDDSVEAIEPLLLVKFRKFLANREAERIPGTRWCYKPGCETAILPSAKRRRKRNHSTSAHAHSPKSATKSAPTSTASRAWVMDCLNTVARSSLRCLISCLDCLLRCLGLENVCGGPGPALVCPTCDADVCSRCGREWHGWAGSCEAVVDLTLQEFRKSKFLQPCPNCRREVEKVDACPHMSCPCGHQWCWVCRGNFPCANLHFGKSGYGSSIEIGDLKSMQRLSVFARMVSTCCFFPIFALFIGTGSTVWFSVIFFTCLLLVCFNCLKGLSKIKRFSESLEPVVDNLKYDAKKVAKVLGYACTGFPILFGVILFFALLFLFIALLHIVGIFLIPYSMAYICADFGMLLRVRRKTFDRLFKERGIVAVCAVFFEANQLEPYQSSLNTNFAVIDCSSEFFDSLMMGIPSPKFLRSYCPDKGGHLTPKFVSSGRRALACTMFAFLFPPTFALGCCLAPLAPLFLLPLAAYPRDPVPKHLAPLVSPVVGGIFFCLFAFLVPSWIPSLASVFSLSEGGLVPCIIPACLATVISWVILRRPALSSCACCAPLWLLSYSIPLSLIVGRNQARSYLAFSPVPDIILQLPTMFIMLFIEHLME